MNQDKNNKASEVSAGASWLAFAKRMAAVWLEKAKMHDHFFMLATAIFIGVTCGYGAVGLRLLIDVLHVWFWGVGEPVLATFREMSPWRILLVPAVGGLLVGPIVYYFAREARGHGVPEVMEAVALQGGIIRARVAVAKAIASALTIASGGSAGREGPVIQIGSAVGSTVGQYLKVSRRRLRTFVGCGAAAGIAATFNAPIAGALFSVEVILGEFGVAQFSPIVISSVMATVVARSYLGDAPIFTVPQYELGSNFELLPYCLLGLLCGVIAFLFIRTLYAVEDRVEAFGRVPSALKPMLGGLALGLCGLAFPHVYGDGYETINLALTDQVGLVWLALLLVAKLLATSFTLGSGGSGGIFAPSLFLGAMTGGLVGRLAQELLGASAGAAGGYALVGMGGVVAATTFAPISAILIIFEITYDYSIILPLMTVCILSTVVSSRLSKESIYTLKLVRRGIDISHGRSLDVLKSLKVSSCQREDFESMFPETPMKHVINRMVQGDLSQFYVTDREGSFVGVIVLSDLRQVLLQRGGLEEVLMAEDVANEGVDVCLPDESLSHALLKFEGSGLTELPVVNDPVEQKLVGVLKYADVASVYNQEVIRLDTAGGMSARVSSLGAFQKMRLAEGFSIAEWTPPSRYFGKTLVETELAKKHGLRVLLVKRRTEGRAGDQLVPEAPGGDYVIDPQDTFVLCGRDEDLDRVGRIES